MPTDDRRRRQQCSRCCCCCCTWRRDCVERQTAPTHVYAKLPVSDCWRRRRRYRLIIYHPNEFTACSAESQQHTAPQPSNHIFSNTHRYRCTSTARAFTVPVAPFRACNVRAMWFRTTLFHRWHHNFNEMSRLKQPRSAHVKEHETKTLKRLFWICTRLINIIFIIFANKYVNNIYKRSTRSLL